MPAGMRKSVQMLEERHAARHSQHSGGDAEEDDEEDGDDEDSSDDVEDSKDKAKEEVGEKATPRPLSARLARVKSGIPRLYEQYSPKVYKVLFSYQALATFAVVVVLAILTVSLAMGCDESTPFGRMCFAPGLGQLIIAFSPLLIVVTAVAWYLHRGYMAKVKEKEEEWRGDEDAQQKSVEVLDEILRGPAKERTRYAKQVVDIMKDFPDKTTVQHKACTVLEAVCRAQHGGVAHVVAVGAVPPLITALETHARVRQVQRSVLSALACVAKYAKQQVFDLGGIPLVITTMSKFKKDQEVQLAAAMTIGGLCQNSPFHQKSVRKYGGVHALVNAVERHTMHADVLVAASEALHMLSKYKAETQDVLLPWLPNLTVLIKQQEVGPDGPDLTDADSDDSRHMWTERKVVYDDKEREVAVRALRRLEAQLKHIQSEVDKSSSEDDEVVGKLKLPKGSEAKELHARMHKWNEKERQAYFKDGDVAEGKQSAQEGHKHKCEVHLARTKSDLSTMG